MVHCTITLENNNRAFYFAGEVLKGSIELLLDKPKKFRGLYFKVHGEAYCDWWENERDVRGYGEDRRVRDNQVHYEGREVYLHQRTYLFGHDGAEAIEMPCGGHRYEFAFQLPPMLPASFEAKFGHIRYDIESVLDVPWGFDKEFKLQFTVVGNDDLNFEPELKLPCQGEKFRRFCCLFCKSDPLVMTLNLPCTGFVPGQNVPITINYDNKSDVTVDKTRVGLNRIIRYNSQTPFFQTKIEAEKMAELRFEGVNAASDVSIQRDFMIPQIMVTSNSRYCNVVQVSYELVVEADVSGCHSNLEVRIPIVIGSVPIISDQSMTDAVQMNVQPVMTSVPMVNQYNDNFAMAPVMPPLPPPVYDGITANQTKFDAKNYQPPPPTFGWNNQAPPIFASAPEI